MSYSPGNFSPWNLPIIRDDPCHLLYGYLQFTPEAPSQSGSRAGKFFGWPYAGLATITSQWRRKICRYCLWFPSGMQLTTPLAISLRNDTDYAGRGRHQLFVIPPPIRVADDGNYFDWWWQDVPQSSSAKGPAHVNAFILIDVTGRLIEREKLGALPLAKSIVIHRRASIITLDRKSARRPCHY